MSRCAPDCVVAGQLPDDVEPPLAAPPPDAPPPLPPPLPPPWAKAAGERTIKASVMTSDFRIMRFAPRPQITACRSACSYHACGLAREDTRPIETQAFISCRQQKDRPEAVSIALNCWTVIRPRPQPCAHASSRPVQTKERHQADRRPLQDHGRERRQAKYPVQHATGLSAECSGKSWVHQLRSYERRIRSRIASLTRGGRSKRSSKSFARVNPPPQATTANKIIPS